MTSEYIDPVYLSVLKRMTPAQKLQAVADLYHLEIQRRVESLRETYSDWSNQRLEHEARRSLRFSGI